MIITILNDCVASSPSSLIIMILLVLLMTNTLINNHEVNVFAHTIFLRQPKENNFWFVHLANFRSAQD